MSHRNLHTQLEARSLAPHAFSALCNSLAWFSSRVCSHTQSPCKAWALMLCPPLCVMCLQPMPLPRVPLALSARPTWATAVPAQAATLATSPMPPPPTSADHALLVRYTTNFRCTHAASLRHPPGLACAPSCGHAYAGLTCPLDRTCPMHLHMCVHVCVCVRAGLYTNSTTGYANCALCPAGQYSNPAASQCIDCPKGFYTSKPGTARCQQAAAGFLANADIAATGQVACPAGTFSTRGKAPMHC